MADKTCARTMSRRRCRLPNHPAKLAFDVDKFNASPSNAKGFSSPENAHERLLLLKPFLSPEAFEGYTEIFNIFKNIVYTLYPDSNEVTTKAAKAAKGTKKTGKAGGNAGQDKHTHLSVASGCKSVPRLSMLAAQKVGKSIALGTKSTHYSLNQTALFDPASIPEYLRKFHDQLADDIDEWLQMEPASIYGNYRVELLLGYVMHLLVFNLRTLFYTLIPVLCHWLYEQKLGCFRTLFLEFWLFSSMDPDHEEVQELSPNMAQRKHDPSLDTFWLFHDIGYWHKLVDLLHVASLEYRARDSYDALFLEALVASDKFSLSLLAQVDVHEVYAVMRNNLQHPKNTQILVSIAVHIISGFRKKYKAASTSLEAHQAIFVCYNQMRQFIQTWLSLSRTCLFNSLDKGNHEIFAACGSTITYLQNKCRGILQYLEAAGYPASSAVHETSERFVRLASLLSKLNDTLVLLKAFFLDMALAQGTLIPESPSFARFFASFVTDDYDDETIDDFLMWLDEQIILKGTDAAKLITRQVMLFQHRS